MVNPKAWAKLSRKSFSVTPTVFVGRLHRRNRNLLAMINES